MTHPYIAAYETHKTAAHSAFDAFKAMCDFPVGRVPGMDTVIRLAVRIEHGATIETAALREWLYRVNLSIDRARAFGSPCLLGQ